ncbi:MAG: nucleoside kinase, partial [Clostridia bacterium]
SVEETLEMWPSVRRGEERFIFPYQEEADVMFNSTLHYELPILKKYIYSMLADIPPSSPHYSVARRLVKFLNYFLISEMEDEIGPTSILREFIGGCTFYR